MGIITVNHSLNQAYFVEKKVFENMVKKAITESKLSKSNSFKVEMLEAKNHFKVTVNIEIKKGESYKSAIVELTSKIEDFSINLIDSKPENITIIIDGEF